TADAKIKSPAPKKGGAETSSNKRKKSKDSSEFAEPKAKGPAPKEDGAKASSNKRKKSKDSSESENEEDESDSGASENGSDDDENCHVEEKYRGGGSAGKSSGAAGKDTRRTRGRLPSAEKESTQLLVRNWWKERQAKKSHEEH
ncbi:hypothetical protein MKW92_022446, partial [Papaver armeniacum]